MENFLIAVGTILFFSISAYGWGGLATKYLYKQSTKSKAYDVSVGLAIWVFVGGLLNAFSLAYAVALDAILIFGILLFCVLIYKMQHQKKITHQQSLEKSSCIQGRTRTGKILTEAIPLLIIISAVSFLITAILPVSTFNHHDDFYKYFPRMFRMLQSGKLGGTPFDFVGLDSLGAHSFLQSFVAAHFPLQYINGFDAIFCFLFGGLLINDIGRRAELPLLLRSGAIVAFIVIKPLYVNVSALYSGSLMILALIYSSLLFCDCLKKANHKETVKASLSFALILSTIVALKQTIAPFAVVYFIVFFMLQILISESIRRMVLITGITATASAIILTPWFWSIFEKFIIFSRLLIKKLSHENLAQEPSSLSAHLGGRISELFSSGKLPYGGHASDYSFIVICSLAFALWAGYLLANNKEKANELNLIVVISIGISVPVVYLINVYFARESFVGIRYSCPIIIASFPAIILLLASYKKQTNQLTVLLILGIGIGLFMSGWFGRMNHLHKHRSLLSFPIYRNFFAYCKNSISKTEHETVLSMQKRTQEKATILTWFEHPFLLDFERNNIYTVGSPGRILDAGAFTLKSIQNPDLLKIFLKKIGVRYVIWGYNDIEKAPNNKGTSELANGLKSLQEQNHILYDDGKRVIIDING